MVQIIVSPKEMRSFARELADYTSHIRARDRQLESAIKSLGSTWADEKYRKFSKAHTAAAAQLQTFYRKSERYSAYLEAKALSAEKYLGRS
jgi:uncharacterized protein YukE